MSSRSQKKLAAAILLAAMMLLVVSHQATGSPLQEQSGSKHSPNHYNDLVEDIISDLLNDGDRWKKSSTRLAGFGRQEKQTLRFGRRSDPALYAASINEDLGERTNFRY